MQLPLYRLIAEQTLDVTGDVQLGYITLSKEDGQVGEKFADWSKSDLNDAENLARKVIRDILDWKFEAGAEDDERVLRDCAPIGQVGVTERRVFA